MKVKELQKTVNIAWSPQPQQPILLAAGTAAQQIDSSVNSTLEIYAANLSDPSYDLALKSSRPSQFRFQKLVWSPTGFGGNHANGLIVGGCEGGHIMIYSAAKLLSQEDGLIAQQSKHTGAVYGLDFNPFQNNLLASCASESEIFIWDLNTTTHMFPGNKTKPLEDVKNVAWNRQVQHILASVFSTRCVIWDLRKNEQIIKLSDTQSRVRWHPIQWHPEVATQLWLASEDDQAPVLQLWDLRYATSPSKTIQVHQRGVLGMSWCPYDIDLMVSCGKDNRIYCWNPNNTQIPEGEILSEVATTASWYSDVQWCPRNPPLIASSSLDGNVSIYSVNGGAQQQVQTSKKIADSFPGMENFAQAPIPQQTTPVLYQDLKYPPKWMKRPCGVAFGFGGKLVSFNGKSQQQQRVVNISQVSTEPNLVERALNLTKSMAEAQFIDYCCQKADQSQDQQGRILWYFIKANFEQDPKEEMLNLLGYKKEDNDAKFMKYLPPPEMDNHQSQNNELNENIEMITNRISNLGQQQQQQQDYGGNDESQTVFDGIVASQKDLTTTTSEETFKIPTGDHPDSLITEAIFTGNIEAAVHLCMSSDRMAEALIIASTAGIEFLTKIQHQYLKKQNCRELSHLIMALVSQDWLKFIKNCTLDSWKEALVAILKHSQRKTVDICEKLGDRLLNSQNTSEQTLENTRNAIICFVCAGSIDKLIVAWYQLKRLEHENPKYQMNTDELQELAEILMLMNKSLETQGIAVDLDEKVANFIKEYSGLLVAQGAFTAALGYIMAIRTSTVHPDLNDLQQRISNIIQPQQQQQQQPFVGMQQQQQQQPFVGMQQQQPQPFVGMQQQQRPPSSRTTSFSYAPPQQQQQQPPPPPPPPSSGGVPTPVPPSHTPAMMYGGGVSGAPSPASSSSYQPSQTVMPMGWQQQQQNTPAASPATVAAAPTPPLMTAKGAPPLTTTDHHHHHHGYPPQHPSPRPSPLTMANNLSETSGVATTTTTTRSGGNLHSRSKYVLDPSVAPTAGGIGTNLGPLNTYNNNNNNNPSYPSALPPGQTNVITSSYNIVGQQQQQQPPTSMMMMMGNTTGALPMNTSMAPTSTFKTTTAFHGTNYLPGVMPIETTNNMNNNVPISTPTIGGGGVGGGHLVQKNPTPPPGWNDPPALKSTRQAERRDEMFAQHAGTRRWQKIINHEMNKDDANHQIVISDAGRGRNQWQPKVMETAPAMTAPITHPLFGVDPNQNNMMMMNPTGYMDPNNKVSSTSPYQQGVAPPPPPPSSSSTSTTLVANPMTGGGGGDYLTPMNNGGIHGGQGSAVVHQSNNFQRMAMNYHNNNNVNNNSQFPTNPTNWNTGVPSPGQAPPAAATTTVQNPTPTPTVVTKTKPPLPEEYSYLHTVLEELKTQCLNKATDPRTKRKFVDVTKRLENLYDCLRDQKLTGVTTQALNQIVQYLQMADYNSALATHTQIAFGSDFSQCAGFMPGLKVLIQSANDLQVYLR